MREDIFGVLGSGGNEEEGFRILFVVSFMSLGSDYSFVNHVQQQYFPDFRDKRKFHLKDE